MGLLARFIIAVWIMFSLLVLVSMVIGQLIKHDILTASEEVDGQVYLIYMRDSAYNIHIDLAGKGCFEAPPAFIPYPDGDNILPSQLQYRRFFLKRISRIQDVLNDSASCRQLRLQYQIWKIVSRE